MILRLGECEKWAPCHPEFIPEGPFQYTFQEFITQRALTSHGWRHRNTHKRLDLMVSYKRRESQKRNPNTWAETREATERDRNSSWSPARVKIHHSLHNSMETTERPGSWDRDHVIGVIVMLKEQKETKIDQPWQSLILGIR